MNLLAVTMAVRWAAEMDEKWAGMKVVSMVAMWAAATADWLVARSVGTTEHWLVETLVASVTL